MGHSAFSVAYGLGPSEEGSALSLEGGPNPALFFVVWACAAWPLGYVWRPSMVVILWVMSMTTLAAFLCASFTVARGLGVASTICIAAVSCFATVVGLAGAHKAVLEHPERLAADVGFLADGLACLALVAGAGTGAGLSFISADQHDTRLIVFTVILVGMNVAGTIVFVFVRT